MMRRTQLTGKEKSEVRTIIQERTGYLFDSTGILNQIFRRSSLSAEIGRNSNEIFEFIGDQVLSYYVVKTVAEKCGSRNLIGDYAFRIHQNKFTLIKQALVNNETLAKIIDDWDIAKYLLLGKSDIKNDVVKESKVKADLLEAIFGAIAIKSNWDPVVLETAISKALKIDEALNALIESDSNVRCFDINNAVTTLKEVAENGQCTMPKYEYTGPEYIGYDNNGNPKWACDCKIVNDKFSISRLVFSTSKKDAKNAAAYLILCEHFGMQNKYGPNDLCPSWTYNGGELLPTVNKNIKEN